MLPKTTLGPVIALLLLTLPALEAQQVPKMIRGAAHEKLDFLVGTWDGRSEQQIGGRTIRLTSRHEFQWREPNRTWLLQTVRIGTPSDFVGEMSGSGLFAHDAETNEYVLAWTDDQTAEVFLSRGRWEKETTLVLRGSFVWQGTERFTRHECRSLPDGRVEWAYFASSDGEKWIPRSTTTLTRMPS